MAEDATHTPGPWVYCEDPRHFGFERIINSNDVIIASPARLGGNGAMEANARLIAAAPELLAACQAVLDEFPAFDSKRIESVKRICRAALAKAGGRS